MVITAGMVKELREKTGAGMMDCKRALEESLGNMEEAIEILRKKGLNIAKKKSSREAKEGLLGAKVNEEGTAACLMEVNCETDFVINTDDFQDFVSKTTLLLFEKAPRDLEELLRIPYDNRNTVQEALTALVAKIGENIQVRRFEHWKANSQNGKIGLYLHAGSKIGVLVKLIKAEGKALDAQTVKEIAMHIAAMNPKYLTPRDVPSDILEKEKEILRATVDSSKPKEIQERIVEGKLKKFFAEECLEQQIFIKDVEGKQTVKQWVATVYPNARIEKFVRLQVGT